MSQVLVVGATGQLGTAVVRQLVARGRRVRALVRPSSDHAHLRVPGVELAVGDLRDPASLDRACRGATEVIATANAVIPRGRASFEAVEGQGYASLVAACRASGVRRFVVMSVPVTPHDDHVPTFRLKRRIEELVQGSGLPYTIVRGSLFMDDWLALIGSSIPLRGAEAATLRRPFWFSRLFLGAVGRLVERRGVALVPGAGKARHAFVALEDVAAFLVGAIDLPSARDAVLEVGGPEILSWDEAVAVFARVLGRPVRALHLPAEVFRLQQRLLQPWSAQAANLMGMNWLVATTDTAYEMGALGREFGIPLTSMEKFLREKLRLPDGA
jgi:uncharacterized protein YbjT (DUF2867 family)